MTETLGLFDPQICQKGPAPDGWKKQTAATPLLFNPTEQSIGFPRFRRSLVRNVYLPNHLGLAWLSVATPKQGEHGGAEP